MEMDGSLRRYAWVALAAMAVLCIGGGVFFKERLLFCDASYIAYNVIEHHRLLIQEGRIGSFITQGVPLLAVKAGLPIATALFLYAFSFNFIYMAAATLLFRLRQYALVVLMALYYTLLVTDTWYWTNNEIHQAVMWFFMLVGSTVYMVRQRTSWLVLIPVFVVLAVLAIHTHFIVLLPLGFLLVYLWLNGEQGLDGRKFVIAALLLVAIVALKMTRVAVGSYEQSHLHNVAHLSLGDVGKAIVSHTVKMFTLRLFTLYWPVFIIGGLGLAALLRGRQYKLLCWWLASLTGFVLLMGITYDNSYGDILLFHIESEWQAAGILIAAPFVINWLPQARLQTGLWLLCAVFVVRFVYIGASLPAFRWRVKQTEKILADMRAQKMHKCLLQPDAALQHKYIQWWALTEESLLLSALHGDKSLYTFCFVDSSNLLHRQAQQQPGILLTSFSPAGTSKGSFFIADTSAYKKLEIKTVLGDY